MTLHPDVQAKGQEELDRIIGRNRLPTFEDRSTLPYIEAIYREVAGGQVQRIANWSLEYFRIYTFSSIVIQNQGKHDIPVGGS